MLPAVLILAVILAAFAWLTAKSARYRKKVLAAINSVMAPYRGGDYEAALQAAEAFRANGEITASYCYYRGVNLGHLGRLEEAEIWLRRDIALRTGPRDKRHLAIGLTSLGHVLLQAGRYDEAQTCFEESIHTFPDRGSGYRSMAELFLLRPGNPSEAVRWAKLAIQHEQAGKPLSANLRNLNLGEDLATLAWATAAESHNATEVARLAEAAIVKTGDDHVQSAAQVRYHLGCAFAELGDFETSARHYEEAARIDPQGNWGREARSRHSSTNAFRRASASSHCAEI